ncbi:integrase [Vibrio parahaemolyticus]|uniref:tyrosine-type recombinase/integrase n=2 Tax=Vibrio harveyi group TaxID=717610 RepID=UPI000403FCE2|nr:site-specific integrase [Vibrio parahaemolyticus]EGR3319717.1 site-specific integrase [Vibrio parahaemolyticus]TOE50393.1 integrase [Vibrio parahaemolyticus]TOL95341.1 integrase [Vibrio parahaemolyticus]
MFEIRHYIATNGERFSLLYRKPFSGSPLFYPTAYCARNLRNKNKHNTQIDHLYAIRGLYEWEESLRNTYGLNSIDIHQRLLSQTFFKSYEIDSLSQFLATKKGSKSKIGEVIIGEKINSKLTKVAEYLVWYANEIITDTNQPIVQSAIQNMSDMIISCKRRKISKARQQQRTLAKKLSKETRADLLSIFSNPCIKMEKEQCAPTRYRDVLALSILYDTGMRLGELLGLRLKDYCPGYGGDPDILWIQDYHDDKKDDKSVQDVAKTLIRPLPITPELAQKIYHYLTTWRAETESVSFEDDAPLLVVHLKGDRQGKAITRSGFYSALDTLKEKFAALNELHPHLLRHDWNYRFSLTAKEQGLTEKEETEQRAFLMGWVENSDMPKVYNRRRIQEQAYEIGLQVAKRTLEVEARE